MKSWAKKLEIFVDAIIPFSLIVLAGIIIIELFYEDIAHHYELILSILDNIIVLLFIIDLVFKYIRIKPFKRFLRKSWLDILAVFPFMLIFRVVELFSDMLLFSATLKEGQSILHQSLEMEKEAAHIIKSAEHAKKLSRTSKFFRFLRPLARLPRFVKAVAYFEKPIKHHKTVAFNPSENEDFYQEIEDEVDVLETKFEEFESKHGSKKKKHSTKKKGSKKTTVVSKKKTVVDSKKKQGSKKESSSKKKSISKK